MGAIYWLLRVKDQILRKKNTVVSTNECLRYSSDIYVRVVNECLGRARGKTLAARC